MQSATTLKFVEEGMKVFDRERHEIGKVEYVQFGDDDPDTPEVEAAAPNTLDDRPRTLVDDIALAFAGDELPEEIRGRLLEQGFVRIDANGLFAADRYVTPEQIDSVSGEGLMLNVSKDELVKH
jgi:aspartate-semialdehyde dehydrogenase